jgi:hypothetical protein
MSHEKKEEQSALVTEEEAQQAIADVDLILNDPETARKFTQNLLELGGLKDKPSQARLRNIWAKYLAYYEKMFLGHKDSNNTITDATRWFFYIIFCMLEALSISPTTDGTAHAALLERSMRSFSHLTRDKEIEPSAQGCLEDCFKLFSENYDIEKDTLLQQAAKAGSLEIAKLLAMRGADIWKIIDLKKSTHIKESPLYLAIENASANFVQWLLEEGASAAYLSGSYFSLPSQRENQSIVEDYVAKKYTPAMLRIEDNIQKLRRSLEEASATREALIDSSLLIGDLVDIVSSYIPQGRNTVAEDKAVERNTTQPIPDICVLYIQWVRQKLRELAQLIPVKVAKVPPAIEAEKNEVLKVLTSPLLQDQCETFWRNLKTAQKAGRPLNEVLPPQTITHTVVENKSIHGVAGNPAAFSYSSSGEGRNAQNAPISDNPATPSIPKDNSPKR